MSNIIVSVAELKANLSRILSESRISKSAVIILSRKKPIATIYPYIAETVPASPGAGGLASLAGIWEDLADISDDIERVYHSRGAEDYREIPF